ncbi:glycosyltransferase family 2 protein [Winogradskyella arenosi]|uniref:Glycosyltransferase involved in cell wall biosynthesis n=1 Tax=Winogradskyella arenosi TaxID=533325 RepID=A0A368ZE25_9FLAO|nr:glycosyltransferase [Winogradskyella arenosi]RCW91507.1 glycosyltransferase involved in cell wall biosynthesis [Winogradskyella arenosi]
MNPLVSICIPTYNGEAFLKEALNSIKLQTYNNIEVVVSDDASHDNTLNILERFKSEVDFSVNIYHHLPKGIGANWNNCIEHSNGEYIKFLFQDDVLETSCIKEQVDFLRVNKLKAVCSKRLIINEFSEPVDSGGWYSFNYDLQKNIDFNDYFFFKKKHLKYSSSIMHNLFGEPDTFLYDKSIFNELGVFNENYKQILDLEFSYRLLEKYTIGIQNKRLLKFRLHSNQATAINNGKTLPERKEFICYVGAKYFFYLSKSAKKMYFLEKIPVLQKWGKLKVWMGFK